MTYLVRHQTCQGVKVCDRRADYQKRARRAVRHGIEFNLPDPVLTLRNSTQDSYARVLFRNAFALAANRERDVGVYLPQSNAPVINRARERIFFNSTETVLQV